MPHLLRTLAALIVGGGLAPTPALAGPVLDASLSAATTTRADAPGLGTGIGARVGLPLDAGLVKLVPEAGLTAWSGQGLLVPELGARASVGQGIEPGGYAHVLFPMPTPGGPTRGWDAGGQLAFTMLPVDVGVHAGLIGLSGPAAEPTTYLSAGVNVGFSF